MYVACPDGTPHYHDMALWPSPCGHSSFLLLCGDYFPITADGANRIDGQLDYMLWFIAHCLHRPNFALGGEDMRSVGTTPGDFKPNAALARGQDQRSNTIQAQTSSVVEDIVTLSLEPIWTRSTRPSGTIAPKAH